MDPYIPAIPAVLGRKQPDVVLQNPPGSGAPGRHAGVTYESISAAGQAARPGQTGPVSKARLALGLALVSKAGLATAGVTTFVVVAHVLSMLSIDRQTRVAPIPAALVAIFCLALALVNVRAAALVSNESVEASANVPWYMRHGCRQRYSNIHLK